MNGDLSSEQNEYRPLLRFIRAATSGSSLLILATLGALLLSNSSFSHTYHELLNMPLGIQIGHYNYGTTLHHWINDALMAIFFFVVGLEIKREFMVGELSDFRQAVFPMAAALGGMLVPALIYLFFNWGTAAAAGWGIPMATDIAFALGCLAVLGDRIPIQLKVFLLALAVFDDIGSIVVIAVFYTPELEISALLMAAGVLIIAFLLNLAGVRKTMPYAILGLLLWILTARSGVHATVAGILLAAAIPARAKISPPEFSAGVSDAMKVFPERETEIMYVSEDDRKRFRQINQYLYAIKTPLQDLEETLHPVAIMFIIPIFALANAGLNLQGFSKETLMNPITIGIILGLVAGKQIGITLFSWLSVRMGIARMPSGISMAHVYGISCIGGIGYTMSLFIASLAFKSILYIEAAKIGILAASVISAASGLIILGMMIKSRILDDNGSTL